MIIITVVPKNITSAAQVYDLSFDNFEEANIKILELEQENIIYINGASK